MIAWGVRRFSRRLRRLGFIVYAIALATATHWPALTLGETPISRLDLAIHFVALLGWTVLLAGCEWFGPALSRRNIARSATIAAVYAVVDEVTQGLPGVNRSVHWSDAVANLAGVCAAWAWLRGESALRPGPEGGERKEPEGTTSGGS